MVGGAESICPICFSTEMQWHDGNLLCAVCGSQSQARCDLSVLHMLPNCMWHEQFGGGTLSSIGGGEVRSRSPL